MKEDKTKKETLSETVKEFWKSQRFEARVILFFSVFFSASSIASLSETIFKWKGFILDGVEFYKNTLHPVLQHLAKLFSIHLSATEVDILVVWFMFQLGLFRSLSYSGFFKEVIFHILLLSSYFMVLVSLLKKGESVAFLGTFIFTLVPLFVYGGFAIIGSTDEKKRAIIRLIKCYSVFVLSASIIVILGAVNKGLTVDKL